MAKVTEYSRITKMKDNDVLLVDGPDGTRTILQTDASKQMGGEVIMVNETAGDSTKVVINTTDEEIELATMADLEPVEEDVDELKESITTIQSDIDNGTKTFFFDIIPNSYPNASGGFDTYEGWDRSNYIAVTSGTTVYINNPTKASSDNAFYRSDKSIISRFSIPIKEPYALNIPTDCAYIVISNQRADFFTKIYTFSTISTIKEEAEKALSEIGNIESNALTLKTSRQLFSRSDAMSGYVLTNGNVYPDSNVYDYYPFIDVGNHVGDTLYFSANMTPYNARFVCAYDADKNVVEAEGKQSVATYTIPQGIAYVTVSWSKNADFQCEWDGITPKSDYFNILEPKVNTAVNTVCFGGMTVKTNGDLSGGESFSLDGTCSKKNNVFAFYGKIGTFTGIRIGQGLGYSRGYNIHVTPTGISWQNGTTDGSAIQHGLTITDYIAIIIDIDNDQISHVTVSTNGGAYTRNVTTWFGSDSEIFATADSGTTLTNCEFSFTAKDVKKPIWYFGDSYISNSETRWPYYINQLGYYKNLYLDGFSGAKSSQIYPDVERLFNNGVAPKYLVWALGMNNGDDSTVNSSWLAYYTLLRDLCDKNGVQLVLCTIPNTPTVNNIYKNDVVKNSGLPYIDFASAVNTAVDANTWYSGMLSSDNVHPTAEGARALASKLINDMPIIAE